MLPKLEFIIVFLVLVLKMGVSEHLRKCHSGQFTCGNGQCIKKNMVCDGEPDCVDQSDEKDCNHFCPSSQFLCKNGVCIDNSFKCDGTPDCPHGEDEFGCRQHVPAPITYCTDNEFRCKDSIVDCIHKSSICDGEKDCVDGSDEDPSLCPKFSCPENFIMCNNLCMPPRSRCDGIRDCHDGSDEVGCKNATIKKTCNLLTEFDCGNAICISRSKVCDKNPDCPNSSDENYCSINECEKNNGGCSQKCVDTTNSFYCTCEPGYTLKNGSNTTCEDINECNTPGKCSQICVNEIGNFRCHCEEGYILDSQNNTRCKAKIGLASLLFNTKHDIKKISLEDFTAINIVTDTKFALAIDYDFQKQLIYWTDLTEHKIFRSNINNATERTVVVTEKETISDLAIDWIYNHLYWSDEGKYSIWVSNINGSMQKTLIKDTIDYPRSLCLNPLEGWMFWTAWGTNPKIERAGMDGSFRQIIVQDNIISPNGLTVDFVQKRIYWIDGKIHAIFSSRYDGSDKIKVLHSSTHIGHPFFITTFEDYVYWTDFRENSILRADKFTGDGIKPIVTFSSHTLVYSVRVYHLYRQPNGTNYCNSSKLLCSHLCLPAPRLGEGHVLASCACPNNFKLQSDGQTCIDEQTMIHRPKHHGRKLIELSTTTNRHILKEEKHIEAKINDNEEGESSLGMSITITILIIAIVAGVVFLVYRNYVNRKIVKLEFQNPIYYNTSEDDPIAAIKETSHQIEQMPHNPKFTDITGVS